MKHLLGLLSYSIYGEIKKLYWISKREATVNNPEYNLKIPPTYELKGQWRLNVKGWALIAILSGSVLVFGLSLILGIIIRGLFNGIWEGTISITGWIFFPIVLGLIVAVIILHEAVHGLLFLILGGKPRFGFKLIGHCFPVAYATSSAPIRRNQYLLIALSPFLILTPIFMIIGVLATTDNMATLALIAVALNIAGSIGDFAASCNMLRHSRKALFTDTEEGFNWYVPSS